LEENRNAPLGERKKEKKMTMSFVQKFWQDESGQDLIEYTLLLAFVALASASLFASAGSSVSGIWGSASTQLSNAATSAS
jgi:Flp pilus assembly pilin Flp